MSVFVFDGIKEAYARERVLAQRVRELRYKPRLLTIVLGEDAASVLYTQLKHEAAVRVGLDFDRVDVSINDSKSKLVEAIQRASAREDVHGVMVQKPAKSVWKQHHKTRMVDAFANWWRVLANAIEPNKDADCLSEQSLSMVYASEWRIVPATVKAVLSILEIALANSGGNITLTHPSNEAPLSGMKASVIGRSDIVGKPLAAVLQSFGAEVSLVGSNAEDLGSYTASSDIVVSATGVHKLVGEDVVKPGAIVIDVGSPSADVDFEAVKEDAAFITPVPNGVGPMTVVSLLENLVDLVSVK